MVDFRINWTLPIGEVKNLAYRGWKNPGYDPGRCGFQPHRILTDRGWKLCLFRQAGIPLCGTRFIGEYLPNTGAKVLFIFRIHYKKKGQRMKRNRALKKKLGFFWCFLFQDEHLSCCGKFRGLQAVEVNARSNLLTHIVTPVPVRRSRARHIKSLSLETEVQCPHDSTRRVVNVERDIC